MKAGEEESGEIPDREHFQEIVADLDALKKFTAEAGISTRDQPLGVHPGLKAKVPGLRERVIEFLSKHLSASRLDAMALMALEDPEPWIFVAMAKLPPSAEHFSSIPFL